MHRSTDEPLPGVLRAPNGPAAGGGGGDDDDGKPSKEIR